MARLEPIGDEVQCSECEMIYQVIWNRSPLYDRVEVCPFCGSEFEEDD